MTDSNPPTDVEALLAEADAWISAWQWLDADQLTNLVRRLRAALAESEAQRVTLEEMRRMLLEPDKEVAELKAALAAQVEQFHEMRGELNAALAEARADGERLVLAGAALVVWLDDWRKRMDANYVERREYDFAGALYTDGERFVQVVDDLRTAIDAARRAEGEK